MLNLFHSATLLIWQSKRARNSSGNVSILIDLSEITNLKSKIENYC